MKRVKKRICRKGFALQKLIQATKSVLQYLNMKNKFNDI